MNDPAVPRLAAAGGIAATVLVISGLIASVAAGRPETTLSSTDAEIAAALTEPASGAVWIGGALEAAGLLALLLFAAGLARVARPDDAALASAGTLAAAAYVGVSLAALAAGNLVADQAGPNGDLVAAGVLNDLWGALYAMSWAACGAFLVFTGAALHRAGVLGRVLPPAAIAIGALSLVLSAAPESGAGQAVGFLPWLWFAVAGGTLLRRNRTEQRPAEVALSPR